jgi:Spy/CpxP family protein refolding chaperone
MLSRRRRPIRRRRKEATVGFARRGFALFAAAALLLSAAQATAQSRGGGSRGGQRAQNSPDRSSQQNRIDRLEQLIEELREDLNLAPEQQNAWESYTGKLRGLASDMSRENARAKEIAQMDVLRRIDHAVDVAGERMAAMEEIAAAAKKLYAVLTPQQQSIANPRLATIIPAQGDAGATVAPPPGGK